MTVTNSPWDPRYEESFYLAVNADKNYSFFKEIGEAQQFVEHAKSEGKGIICHVLTIQTLFNAASDPTIQPSEVMDDAVESYTEIPENEPETQKAAPEIPTE